MNKTGYFFSNILIMISIFSTLPSITNQNILAQEYEKQDDIELEGVVNHVIDGDTLDINDTRIRLALVDTPERGQDGYKKAKDFVTDLCFDKKGAVDIDDGQRRGDRYGREIGVVFCDGINVNNALMENNLSKIYVQYCDISEFANEKWAKPYCN